MPVSGCFDEEDLIGFSGIDLQHSQHPYFRSSMTVIGASFGGSLAEGTGGWVMLDWGEAGPFFVADVATNSLDYAFNLEDYPLTLNAVHIRAACIGTVDTSLSIEVGISPTYPTAGDGSLQRLDGSDAFAGISAEGLFANPDAVARFPLSSLSLVDNALTGTVNADPIVPELVASVNPPLTLTQPSVIFRRVCLVDTASGVFHLSTSPNIVLGTQRGSVQFFTYTTTSMDPAFTPTGVWVESVPSLGAAPIVRNPYLQLCFGSMLGRSSVQFVG